MCGVQVGCWSVVALSRAVHAVRYGGVHRAVRARVGEVVRAGRATCARCGLAIAPDAHWDLGHVDGDGSRWSGPEHRRCNRATRSHSVRRVSRRW